MSKNCYLRCRTCNDDMNEWGQNWAHRELHQAATHAVETAEALRRLRECGFETDGLTLTINYTTKVDANWLEHHATHALYVIDEYGAEWPCACGGSHTGECRPEYAEPKP